MLKLAYTLKQNFDLRRFYFLFQRKNKIYSQSKVKKCIEIKLIDVMQYITFMEIVVN